MSDVFITGDSFYACKIKNVLKNSLYNVIGVNPATSDVQLIVIENDVEFLPGNLENFFPKIAGIKIDSDFDFKLITKDDLRVFQGLKYLSIRAPLEVIGAGAFSSNPNLEVINIDCFFLSFIHETAFNGLSSLKSLSVSTFLCILVGGNRTEVEAALSGVTNCKDSAALVTRFESILIEKAEGNVKLAVCEEESKKKDSAVERVKELEKQVSTLNALVIVKDRQIAGLNTSLTDCESQKSSLKEQYDLCEDALYPPSGNCRFSVEDDGYTCFAREISLNVTDNQGITWNGTYRNNQTFWDVTVLRIESMNFEILPRNISFSFPNITKFYIYSSNLSKIMKDDFLNSGELKVLSIVGNKIESIEVESFDPLKSLNFLDLSSNQIATLPRAAFSDLPQLIHLDLSVNSLTTLDKEIINANNDIQHFSARGNKLTRVDIYFVSRLKNSGIIDFTDNTLCSLKYDQDDTIFDNFNKFFLEIVLGRC